MREIVRNRVAVYADTAERWIRLYEERGHGRAPLVVAMRKELRQYRAREREKNRRYLFP